VQERHVEGWSNTTVVLLANERMEILGLENICSGSAGSGEKRNSSCDRISGKPNASTNVADLVRNTELSNGSHACECGRSK